MKIKAYINAFHSRGLKNCSGPEYKEEVKATCYEQGWSFHQASVQGDGGRRDHHSEGEAGVFSRRHQEPFEQQVQF